MNYVNQLISNEFEFLKAFPMMILYKNDINFTNEIIDHYIEYYTNENEYIAKIPYEKLDINQKMKYIHTALKNGLEIHEISHIKKMRNDNFEIGYQILKAHDVYLFNGNITAKQKKIVNDLIFRKLKSPSFARRVDVPEEMIEKLCNTFMNRHIKYKQAKSFIIFIKSYFLNSKDDYDLTFVYNVLDKILEQYPDLIIEIADYKSYKIILDYIFKHVIPTRGQQFLIDSLIKHWNIKKSNFKDIKKATHYNSGNGLLLIQLILGKYGMVTAKFDNKTVTIYNTNIIHYNITKIINILRDVNNLNAYVSSQYKELI